MSTRHLSFPISSSTRFLDKAQLHAVTGAVTAYPCPQGEACDYDQATPLPFSRKYTGTLRGPQIPSAVAFGVLRELRGLCAPSYGWAWFGWAHLGGDLRPAATGWNGNDAKRGDLRSWPLRCRLRRASGCCASGGSGPLCCARFARGSLTGCSAMLPEDPRRAGIYTNFSHLAKYSLRPSNTNASRMIMRQMRWVLRIQNQKPLTQYNLKHLDDLLNTLSLDRI